MPPRIAETDPTALTPAQGKTCAHDAFGNQLSAFGTRLGELGYGGAFGYQEDEGSGLRLLGHRYYDSSTGRFLKRDPIKDGRNWYVYCKNDPLGYADPTGLLVTILIVGACLISIAGLVRLGSDAGKIIDEAMEGKRDPASNVWGDPDALDERIRNRVPDWLEGAHEIAKDQLVDQYLWGPVGEAGGPGVQITIEGMKQVHELVRRPSL